MNSYDDDERERPSWRDRDRKKDRSKHVSGDKPAFRPKSAKAQWAQKQYLKEVENLFKGKKASKDHGIAHEAIHRYSGTGKFNATVKKYIAEYDLPDDWSTLFLLLDYKELKVVKRVIAVLKEKSQEEPLNIKEGFKSKLRIIAMTTPDSELKEIAEETVEGL
jgi:hypothetical protein